MKLFKVSIFFIFLLVITSFLSAQENLVEMTKFYPEEIQMAGFTLSSEQNVTVKTTTISPRRHYRQFNYTYTWILNSDTRDLVWELSETDAKDRSRNISTFETEIELAPGTYEVYYSTYPDFKEDYYARWDSKGYFPGIFNILLDSDDDERKESYKFFDDLYDQLYLIVEGTGTKRTEEEIEKRQADFNNKAFISFTKVTDEEHKEQIFKVTEPVEMNVYALGEARRDGDYDFGTIINLKSRERVWKLSYSQSTFAGGDKKNRVTRDTIHLEPGIYKALYVTDDSHSYKRWNTSPPFDPSYWGMTLWMDEEGGQSALAKLDSDDELNKSTVVEFIKAGNSEYLMRGITLKKSLNLHIYALGEGNEDDMYDYGWIVDMKTHEKVWTMDYFDTEDAGGARKNRLFDGIVNLQPGNYMVYFITDGSHSYHSWNSSPPFDKEKWGITVSVLDDHYQDGDIVPYEEEEDIGILARLVRVRDDEREKTSFSLTEDGLVHVYAIGEGSHGEMYDYAWIENKNTGRVVWEMTYRKTQRAGGARKNRVFDDKVYLEAGDYIVYYETDDSHSFNDWNDRPPRDPFNWGVTISKIAN